MAIQRTTELNRQGKSLFYYFAILCFLPFSGFFVYNRLQSGQLNATRKLSRLSGGELHSLQLQNMAYVWPLLRRKKKTKVSTGKNQKNLYYKKNQKPKTMWS